VGHHNNKDHAKPENFVFPSERPARQQAARSSCSVKEEVLKKKTKRLAQDRLIDAILPTGVLGRQTQSNEHCMESFSDGTILARRLSSPNIP